jgi:alpha/beta superfamily hydrolase
MYNKVISAIARALVSQGVIVLRFNFRGVGKSGGSHDQGRGEQADVAGALDWLLDQPQVDPWRVSLVGYSFGAWVGLNHAQADPRVVAVAAVGLPAWTYDAGFSRRNPPARLVEGDIWQYDPGFMQSFNRPKLFVVGEHDGFAPAESMQRFVNQLPPPAVQHTLPGTDHFFAGREADVGRLVADFVSEL